jgi:hypothetical protein
VSAHQLGKPEGEGEGKGAGEGALDKRNGEAAPDDGARRVHTIWPSSPNDSTWAPTMELVSPSTNTLRTMEVVAPCTVTTLAI